MDYVPSEYCLDWGDGTHTSGLFPTGYAVVRNIELPHVYHYTNSDQYQSSTYSPVITIKTVCGGVRSVGETSHIYCFRSDVSYPAINTMATYKMHPDFYEASCAGIFKECDDGQVRCDGTRNELCMDGSWQLNTNNPTGGACGGNVGGTGVVCQDSNTRCVNGVKLSWCSVNGVGGYTDNGLGSCSGADPFNPCTNPCAADYCDATGREIKCMGGCSSYSGRTCNPTQPILPSDEEDASILQPLIDFYTNNKTMAIIGIALLGGFMLFGKKE